jgi:hypothetical protein
MFSKLFSFSIYFPIVGLIFAFINEVAQWGGIGPLIAVVLVLISYVMILVPIGSVFMNLFGSLGDHKFNYCKQCNRSGFQLFKLSKTLKNETKVDTKMRGGHQSYDTVDVKDSSGTTIGTAEVEGEYYSGDFYDVVKVVETKIYKCPYCSNKFEEKSSYQREDKH